METTVRKICCQGCGATLPVEDGVRYLTCNYCDARLEVVSNAATSHTRLLEEIGDRTDRIERKLDAIRARETPVFDNPDDAVVYEFARQIQETGQVEPDLYAQAVARWDAVGVVELTAVIGYYTMVSMTLNAHEIPMPDDAPPPLDTPRQAGAPVLSRLAPLTGSQP